MSKALKITIIIACVLLVLGGALFLIGGLLDDGFSLRERGSEQVKDCEEFITEKFDSVELEEISADVQILLSTDGKCRVEYRQSERNPLEISVRNDKLKLARREKSVFLFFTVNTFTQDVGVTKLYLPAEEYRSLSVQTVSGDISIPELQAQDASLETVSGSVDLTAVCVTRVLDCKTVSGDITLTDCDGQKLELETVSGDITASLRSAKQISTSTVSGTVKAPSEQDGNGTCRAETVSGDIQIQISAS